MGGRLGKLRAAARWLLEPDAAGTDEGEDAAQALQDLGVPLEQAQALAGHDQADDSADHQVALELWAWHVDAVELFKGLRTQWQVVATVAGLWHEGLRYEALPVVEQRLGIQATADTFRALQVMEIEGRRILNDL